MPRPPTSTLFPYTTLFRSLHDRPPGRHRLEDAEGKPLAVRREDDEGRALVEAAELVVRHEAEGVGDSVTKRPVAGDDEVHALRRRHELLDPLLRGEPSDEEHL